MKSLILNCTLKKTPVPSSTQALSKIVCNALHELDVESEIVRVVDMMIAPGASWYEGEGDAWPQLRQKILEAKILILASPTWLGRPSSVLQRVIERMDAFISETNAQGEPIIHHHVAGFIATGNEDGAKHVIGEMAAALIEIGFTVPGQSFTYYNNGVATGSDYIDSPNAKAKQRSHELAERAAYNLVSAARTLCVGSRSVL